MKIVALECTDVDGMPDAAALEHVGQGPTGTDSLERKLATKSFLRFALALVGPHNYIPYCCGSLLRPKLQGC